MAQSFGARLQAVIAAHQTTPADVARRMGKTVQWLQNYTGSEDNPATANPTVTTLLKIAAAIPASVEELCAGIDAAYDVSRRAAPVVDQLRELLPIVDRRAPSGTLDGLLALLRPLALGTDGAPAPAPPSPQSGPPHPIRAVRREGR